MPNRTDPQADDLMDETLAIDAIARDFQRSGRETPAEVRLIDNARAPLSRMKTRYRAETAFAALLKNGINRYTRRMATGAGITVVTDHTGTVTDLHPTTTPAAAAA